ncbi:MAG: hypothetical protein ACRCWB_01445 [Enterovibrio sp.]
MWQFAALQGAARAVFAVEGGVQTCQPVTADADELAFVGVVAAGVVRKGDGVWRVGLPRACVPQELQLVPLED